MSNDIRDILNRFNRVEESLNADQKSVKQLPALFKPKDISPVLGSKKDPQSPVKGYFVGGESVEEDTSSFGHEEELDAKQLELDPVQAVDEQEQITIQPAKSDTQVIKQGNKVLGTVNNPQLAANIKAAIGKGEMTLAGPATNLRELHATEDVVSTVKKKLGDYLKNIEDEIRKDPDLKDKAKIEIDKIGPAVKTITTDDGHEIKIHGNEDDGFRISIKNKPAKSKFETLDHAVMACEMYCNQRRRGSSDDQDYIEEKK